MEVRFMKVEDMIGLGLDVDGDLIHENETAVFVISESYRILYEGGEK